MVDVDSNTGKKDQYASDGLANIENNGQHSTFSVKKRHYDGYRS